MSLLWIVLSLVPALPAIVFFFMLAVASFREKAPRAAYMALGALFVSFIPFFLALVFPAFAHWITLIEAVFALAVLLLLFALPNRPKPMEIQGPLEKYDERETMFARMDMTPDEPAYAEYYEKHPEHRDVDEKLRRKPPIYGLDSKSAYPPDTLMAEALFTTLEKGKPLTQGEKRDINVPMSPETLAKKLHGLAESMGAVSSGTTALKQAHAYSHRGRTADVRGEPVVLNHAYAFVFTVEMNWERVASAPDVPSIVETALRYADAFTISVAVAEYLRTLGHEARAHTDANYLAMVTPVAYDAGLGEIGRFGSLVTPQAGTRVRIGLVTTTAELPQDEPLNTGIAEFCTHCLKCAHNCPSGAISRGKKEPVRGVMKWPQNQEKCYGYWREKGSDCGICMRSCPYSRPGTPVHNCVRWMLSKSSMMRRYAARIDDALYGRKPHSGPWQDWFGD